MFGKSLKEAQNPYTTFTVLRKLAESKKVKIREAVAGNQNVQTYVMENLATDDSVKVRAALATNPKLSNKAWKILSEDSAVEVIEMLKTHYPEPPEVKSARS